MLDFVPSAMKAYPRFLLILLLAHYASAAPAKTVHRAPGKPVRQTNIILITVDTTRADRMGFLGSKRGLTPNLDALALQSSVFTRAYSQVPLTTPSHAALLTGTYPQFNHLEDLGMPLAKNLPYLPALLKQRGYHTAAFLGGNILDAKGGTAPGFDRGFDLYDANFHDPRPGEDRYHSVERRAGEVADRALRWIGQRPQEPFFVWLHFFDAHDPYDPPSPFKERYKEAPYDGEIAYIDSVMGNLLDTLRQRGLFQGSIIMIAADHGEAFGEHGEERHGMFLYDETIHVPLLLKLPEQKFAGTRIDTPVALADVAPSLLQGAGVTAPATMQGQSLFPLLLATQSAADETNKLPDRAIYSASSYARRIFGVSDLHAWRTPKYLYVRAPRRELYDIPLDPAASKNLAPSAKAVSDTLDTQLSTFLQKTSSAHTEDVKLDPAVVEKLHALGYMAAESSRPRSVDKGGIDPKDKIEIANLYHRALIKGEIGQFDQEIADLRELVTRDPDLPGAQFLLGSVLLNTGKYQDAVPFLRAAADAWPESAPPHYELGLTLGFLGETEAALKEMQAAAVCYPSSGNLHYLIGTLQMQLQQVPEATKEFAKTIELDPNHFEARLTYGRLILMQGNADAAIPVLMKAIKLNPENADAHMTLADAYTKLGEMDKAAREVATYQRLFRAANQPK